MFELINQINNQKNNKDNIFLIHQLSPTECMVEAFYRCESFFSFIEQLVPVLEFDWLSGDSWTLSAGYVTPAGNKLQSL